MNDIYRPRSFIDEENNFMPVLNEYTPNKYYEEATPVKVKPDNVYMRAIEATIGKDNIMWRRDTTQPNHKGIMISAIDYYHHYMARVMFGDRPPAIKLWMAAPTRAEGAAGKSLAGIEFPSKVMGRVVVQQTAENINKGWGDNIVNARLISIEDLEKLTPNDFNKFYGVLKRIGTNSIARLNMKGNNYVDLKLKVAMSLSTNWRPLLPQSDRWIVALEPAWLNGKAERLSQEDISLIIDKLESDEHDQEAQDVVNYWYHLWLNERELYKNDITTFAPITAYRIKWVTQTTKNTKNIIPLLPEPNDLFGLIKDGYCPIDCFKFLVANYQEKTRQTALPWKWFAEFLKSVAPDSMEGTKNGKSTIAGLLEIDWENPGVLYNKWHQNPEWEAKAGITKRCNPHTFRHSRASELAKRLKESPLCQYFGWVIGSDQVRTYVHLSGRDLDPALLKLAGLEAEAEKVKQPEFTLQRCPRCGELNPPNEKTCRRCGNPLQGLPSTLLQSSDEKVKKLEERIEKLSSQLDQIMERLSKLGERSLNEHEPIIKKIRQSLND